MFDLLRKVWTARGRRRILLNGDGSMPTQVLLPRPHGYTAYWVFEVGDDSSTHALLVHLTRSEARRVRKRDPYREGFLEPVRKTLRNPIAAVLVERPDLPNGRAAMYIRIPASGDEREFLAHIDAAAYQVPWVVAITAMAPPPVEEVIDAVQATEHNIEQHLSLA